MLSGYTMVIILCWMTLGILCILVHENSWIPGEDKRLFYMAYAVIAGSALAEWSGVQIQGRTDLPGWLLPAIKCFDYILTPMAGGALVAPMKVRNRAESALRAILICNAVLQIITGICGGMIVIDSRGQYSHGPLYPIYMGIYLAVIFLTIAVFMSYGQNHRRQNRGSLYAVMVLVITGIAIQEVIGNYRTAYLAMTIGVALLFIHYAEFYQMTAAERIRKQGTELMTDALTGVYSRYAYLKELKEHPEGEILPEDFVSFTIDINELKYVNDNLGHDAGDELIIGAAQCIEKVFTGLGKCFRTGGDEFVVLGRMDPDCAEAAKKALIAAADAWNGEEVHELSLSVGYCAVGDEKGLTVQGLAARSDQAMYAEKREYYQRTGHDRRRTR